MMAATTPVEGRLGERQTFDLLIVGAGPAGLSAAVAAARAGAKVVVVDEEPRVGGRIGRSPSPLLPVKPVSRPGPYGDSLHSLVQAFEQLPILHLPKTLVWGIFDDRVVTTDHPNHPLIAAKHLLIANGAYETPVAFPGWTLPGATTVGGLQQLLKTQGLVPGGRVLLSGTGPFLYLAADQLASYGVRLVAVADLASRADWVRWGLRLARLPKLLREGLGYLWRLRRRRIPILYRHAAIRALGDQAVQSVVVAEVDHLGLPVAGSERSVAVDLLAFNAGFTPATDLTHMAGCEHVLDRRTHHWLPVVDDRQRTSRPGIHAAGDCTGIGYLPRNLVEGEIAGTDIAGQLGLLAAGEADQRLARLQRQHAASAWYSVLLAEIYAFQAGRVNWADNSTVVCRCEGVTREAVEESMAAQVSVELDAVKRLSRAGMGQCQGKLCFPTILGLLSRELSAERWKAQDFSARPPLKPISMQALADLAETVRVSDRARQA